LTRATSTRRNAGTAIWSLTDQGLSSVGSLALSVLVARSASEYQFGAFTAGFLVYSLALTGTRALISMPYQMALAKSTDSREEADLTARVLGATVMVALLPAAGILVWSLFVDPAGSIVLLVTAIALPGLLLQDACRYVVRHYRDVRTVAVVDGVWSGAQLLLSVVVVVVGLPPSSHVIAWAVGAAASVAFALVEVRPTVSPVSGLRHLWSGRRRSVPLLIESLAITGSYSASQFSLAAFGGLADIAPLRAANVALGPVNVANGGLLFVVTPAVLRRAAANLGQALRLCAVFSGAMTIVSLVCGLALLLVPADIGTALFGQSWAGAGEVILPSSLALAAYALQSGAVLGFRALDVTVRSMVIHLLTFPLPSIGAVLGYSLADVTGAAWGLAATAALVSLYLWFDVLWVASRRQRARRTVTGAI
jgi:O-antigen/teichoic acid export membrane protein